MGKKCMVQSCGKYTYRFCLPKNEKQAVFWLQRSGNEDMPTEKKGNAKICPLHFNEKCFLEYGQKKLKKGAIPSLFLPNYTATGEAGDNFYFEIPMSSTRIHTPEKKGKHEIPATDTDYSLIGKVITPRKTYSRSTGAEQGTEQVEQVEEEIVPEYVDIGEAIKTEKVDLEEQAASDDENQQPKIINVTDAASQVSESGIDSKRPKKRQLGHLDAITKARLELIEKEKEHLEQLQQIRLEEARYRRDAAKYDMLRAKDKLKKQSNVDVNNSDS